MRLLADRIHEYTPEWRYEPGDGDDPGAAIAELFGEMFQQTIDRFNRIPQKTYIEFLNMLGVESPTVTPASGFVRFSAGGSVNMPIQVPKGTEVFAKSNDGQNIIFETERSIEAVDARLEEIYYLDPEASRIERTVLPGAFFSSSGGENLQRHRLTISQNEVLNISGACAIELQLRQSSGFAEENTAKLLADPEYAVWSYLSGGEYRSFERVSENHGSLTLEKDNGDRLEPDDNGRICVYCDFSGKSGEAILLNGVSLRSNKPEPAPVDSMSNNDIPITKPEGGYCFGRRPMIYEMFYIRADEVFDKRLAQVMLELDVVPVVHSDATTDPQYEFSSRIIDKELAVSVEPDDVFVERVVWEYYNGSGWAPLTTEGNANPFSCKDDGVLVVRFTVPADMTETQVNAETGCYIRARVTNVENYLSPRPRWILPFVKDITCEYRYPAGAPADYVSAHGNGDFTEIPDAAPITNLSFNAYSPMPQHPRAMYLRFDHSPHGMPLSLFFDIGGESLQQSKVSYELWVKDRFVQARVIDGTQNLKFTGSVLLYISEPLTEREFFGTDGYWLRMCLSSGRASPERATHVKSIVLNCVNALQRQKASDQYFNTGAYDAGKRIALLEKPVLECDVWVDEPGISESELAQLSDESPESVQVERSGSELRHCWIKWQRTPSIAQVAPGERAYELDSYSGQISFGTAQNGRVPPRGDLNIRVSYSYGGGALGNLEPGRVNALIGSIPRVNGVFNITPMSGGTDKPPMAKLESIGNKRIRHRFTALSLADFEEMTYERFEQAALVKCFAGTDADGNSAPGHVCLAVMGRDMDERMASGLCESIYSYLAPRADCNLVAGGRLHVVPSTVITVSVEVLVLLHDPDLAALTQQDIAGNIGDLIDRVWRSKAIGEQIDINEIYQVVKATPNVKSITRILPEGRYTSGGTEHLTALDGEVAFPFATVRNGSHTIQVG